MDWVRAMAPGLGPWPLANAMNHGHWPCPLVMGDGNAVLARGSGHLSCPLGIDHGLGHGHGHGLLANCRHGHRPWSIAMSTGYGVPCPAVAMANGHRPEAMTHGLGPRSLSLAHFPQPWPRQWPWPFGQWSQLPLAMAFGHGQKPWPCAMPRHGQGPQPMAITHGHWPMAMAQGHGPWPGSQAMFVGHGPWPTNW